MTEPCCKTYVLILGKNQLLKKHSNNNKRDHQLTFNWCGYLKRFKQCGELVKFYLYCNLVKTNYLGRKVKNTKCGHQLKINWCGYVKIKV